MIPESSDLAYKVNAHLHTGRNGHHITWGGHAEPEGVAFHAINPGSFEIRFPDDSFGTLFVTDAPIIGDGASISQRIELTGTGDPPEVIRPPGT